MDKGARIFVAGHRGLVGSALCKHLEDEGYRNLVLRTRAEVDLCNQAAVNRFFAEEKPEYVFLAAARVGGILANSTYVAEFIRDNLLIECNVIDAAWRAGVRKLVFLGSSCIYPKHAPQPIPESALLEGALEPTNEWYAIAKIAGLKMVQAYRLQYTFPAISLMPTNLYGPGDNFDLESSHVVPALIRKFREALVAGADEVSIWGTGTPRREFLFIDDLANAALFLMRNYNDDQPINVGTGSDVSILELAECLREISGFRGRIVFDSSRPDGTPRKLLDVTRLNALGWQARVSLRQGLEETWQWYSEQQTFAVALQ